MAKILGILNLNNSHSPDKIRNLLLRNLADAMYQSLWFLFQTAIKKAVFPSQCKMTHIFPVLKDGSKSDISCYRQISVACQKNFSRNFLRCHHRTHQRKTRTKHFGFQRKRSEVVQLLLYLNEVSEFLYTENDELSALFLYFSKTFNTVPQDTLLRKLLDIGILGTSLNLLKSYSNNRLQ